MSLGEIVVNEVNFVKKCISAENSQDDLWGKLICTNFKVSFIPQDDPSKQVFLPSEIKFVNMWCLAIDCVVWWVALNQPLLKMLYLLSSLLVQHIKDNFNTYQSSTMWDLLFLPLPQKSTLSHLLLGEHDIPLTCLEQVVTGTFSLFMVKCHSCQIVKKSVVCKLCVQR